MITIQKRKPNVFGKSGDPTLGSQVTKMIQRAFLQPVARLFPGLQLEPPFDQKKTLVIQHGKVENHNKLVCKHERSSFSLDIIYIYIL